MANNDRTKFSKRLTIKGPFTVESDGHLVVASSYGQKKRWIGIFAEDIESLREFYSEFLGEALDESLVGETIVAKAPRIAED